MRLIDADALTRTLKIRCRSCSHNACGLCLWDTAITAVETFPTLDVAPVWTSVKDRLPKDTGEYLVWGDFGEYDPFCLVAGYDADCEQFGAWDEYYDPHSLGWAGSEFCELKGVYYWMPLPKPPEIDEEDAT